MMEQIVKIFGSLFAWFYSCTGDYGIAIVCLTVLVKLCLLPLYVRQRRDAKTPRSGAGSCLLLLLSLPLLTGLYRTVLSGAGGSVGSRLCPWAGSLLTRDPWGILPVLSAVVQLVPQTYPYLVFFKSLELPKAPKGMMLSSALMIFLICFPLPAAAGIYYLTSGVFTALEQALRNGIQVYRLRTDQQPPSSENLS